MINMDFWISLVDALRTSCRSIHPVDSYILDTTLDVRVQLMPVPEALTSQTAKINDFDQNLKGIPYDL